MFEHTSRDNNKTLRWAFVYNEAPMDRPARINLVTSVSLSGGSSIRLGKERPQAISSVRRDTLDPV